MVRRLLILTFVCNILQAWAGDAAAPELNKASIQKQSRIALNLKRESNNKPLPKLLVVTEDWPPYNFKDRHGNIAGIATKRIELILQQAKVPYSIRLMPWARSFDIALTTHNTLIYSIFRNEEREAFFHWFCPLMPVESIHFFSLSERNIRVESLEDLKDYTIAVSRNEFEHGYLVGLGFKENRNLYVSAHDGINFNQLLNGKVDFVVESPAAMASRLSRQGLKKDHVTSVFQFKPEDNIQHCFAINKGTAPEIVRRIKKAFDDFQSTAAQE